MKAGDITDDAFLAAVDEAIAERSRVEGTPWTIGATRWDVAAVLAGHPEHVGTAPVDYPHMPSKVVLAKARKLIRRGLLDGCACGCRGEFERLDATAAPARPAPGEWWDIPVGYIGSGPAPDLPPPTRITRPVTPEEFIAGARVLAPNPVKENE